MATRKKANKVKRIGILTVGIEPKIIPALQYLVLHLNTLQRSFEFEFLPIYSDVFLQQLSSRNPIDRESIRRQSGDFINRYSTSIGRLSTLYKLKETSSDHFVILSLTKFSDNYYTMRNKNLSIIALGNWEYVMAPPSILEFMVTLMLREAVSIVSPSLRGSIHIGTKGCLEDFTASLADARYKILNGFICKYCRDSLEKDGYPKLADELEKILSKNWLGKIDEINSPANITKKLGYNLFITKGIEQTVVEKFWETIQEEGSKQIIQLVFSVLLVIVLFMLGLSN
ncbi:MAG TPA: hypothetical protein DEP19_00685 [Anaerolineae bacterium]|nr:hypothetical protein [Anaerolineae bacterium]